MLDVAKTHEAKTDNETVDSTIIIGSFDTTFSMMDRTTKQKINREEENLNNTLAIWENGLLNEQIL